MSARNIEKAPWLNALEEETELFISETLQHFQNLEEQTLLRSSATGGWSIAQCLAHLNSYGEYYLPRLQNELNKPAAHHAAATYKSSWLGRYLIKLTDPDQSPKKMKAVKKHLPAEQMDAHQVVAEFLEQQETLLQLLRIARTADVNHMRIPLSIASWVRLPVGDILQFMIVHTRRHLRQAMANLHPELIHARHQ
ncbi:DinB family protein [Dyadobacter crusticola]|uniref:DinB family protein n=1 Tax=Dyadobacter crusticola TaxID=292407 RepID=UPI0004E27390|nr:DinB family protein [Dyadobacter crusticola]